MHPSEAKMHCNGASQFRQVDCLNPPNSRLQVPMNMAKLQPATATAYALAAIGTGTTIDTTSTLLTGFPLTIITLPLMLMEGPLVSKIIDIAKQGFLRSGRCPEVPGNAGTHACASCTGYGAHWITSSLQSLLHCAHMTSSASRTSELCPVRNNAEASICPCPNQCRQPTINGGFSAPVNLEHHLRNASAPVAYFEAEKKIRGEHHLFCIHLPCPARRSKKEGCLAHSRRSGPTNCVGCIFNRTAEKSR